MSLKMIILAFLGSAAPVIFFNIDRKKLFYAATGGALGYVCYAYFFEKTRNAAVATFIGAFAVNIYSEILARIIKTPASNFYVPGIFPLVPGYTAYRTISYMAEGRINTAIVMMWQTLTIGGAVAFGIMLSATIVKYIKHVGQKTKKAFR